jgi:hypothetical protein
MMLNCRSRARLIGPLAVGWLLTAPSTASASLLSPELEDKMASFLAVFILFFVPVAFIVLFWLVHILPEKIAHQRHHPQFEAIRTLCLLSLVFGGLLWPLAWLWAYTKPIGYKLAYGTDKVDHDAVEADGGHGPSGTDDASELRAVRAELAALRARVKNGEEV